MSDPEAVRRSWARTVAEEYDGWPDWPAPDAAAGPRTGEPAADASSPASAERHGGRTDSGWSWGMAPEELSGVDVQLTLRQHTGETARALQEERAYWGLDLPDE